MIKSRDIDYIFWIILILFSNPGGIQNALGISEYSNGVNLNDFLFIILTGLYLIKPKRYDFLDKQYIFIRRYFVFFLFYFVFVFGYITPVVNNVLNYSFLYTIVKLRHAFFSVMLFIYCYHFFNSSNKKFFKVLLISSIIVLVLFLQGLFTGFIIIPYETYTRGFIEAERKLMLSYGFLPFLIPLGVVFIVFKYNENKKLKKLILIAFVLMFITWIISITRRHIAGTIILFILSLVLLNFFKRRLLIPLSGILRLLVFSSIIIFTTYILFPKYIEASYKAVEETIHIVKYGETTTGQIDERLGFSRPFIMDLFYKYPILGTGFDNNWRTGEGDILGYEASDYPFLGALAMTGILGIIIFLPIYIKIIILLIKDIKFIRNNITNYSSYETSILLLFILYFIYDLLQYMNWFNPMSNYVFYHWYIYFAMYLSARKIFYKKYSLDDSFAFSK